MYGHLERANSYTLLHKGKPIPVDLVITEISPFRVV